jgi:hypothetical protein
LPSLRRRTNLVKSRLNPTHPRTKAIEKTPSTFPYDVYKGAEVWRIVEKAIYDLVENGDIVEATRRDYIVGYICKQISKL